MALTQKETKFLTILNETRLTNGKMVGRYSTEVKEQFSFSDTELKSAVNKFVKMDLLSVIDAGGNDLVYFHTQKVNKEDLDKDLLKIRH